ncbi:hypothetical protein [Massilia sp. CT11-137]|uniref:hypothetical protein n=1 Tax=Massilia sp. CT11-137 TaxID=3393901 RepID=UPI0039AF2C70
MKSKSKAQQRQYPRDVWVLSPAYIVKQVTVVRKCGWSTITDYGDVTEAGKIYRPEAMHASKEDAIAWGRAQIAARGEYLAKQHALLDVRRIKLDKAEAKA